ncbi:hypothetical protein IAR50_005608 [Cryptococcus sp. DSM 104548]
MSESELSATPSTDSDGFRILHKAFLASDGSYNEANSRAAASPWLPESAVYVPLSPEIYHGGAFPTFSPSSPVYSEGLFVFSPISPVYTPASPTYSTASLLPEAV